MSHAPRPIPRPRVPHTSVPFATVLLHAAAAASGRRVVLHLGEGLGRLPVEAAVEVADAVRLLLDHADQHPGHEPVEVLVFVGRGELRAVLTDGRCAAACATRSNQLDRLWSLGAQQAERRCVVRTAVPGGLQVTWTAPAPASPARPARPGGAVRTPARLGMG